MRISDHLRFEAPDLDAAASAIHHDWEQEQRRYVAQILQARRNAVREVGPGLTRTRLHLVADAFEHNVSVLRAALEPIVAGRTISEPPAAPSTPAHTRAALPYLFRDWVWGENETQLVLDAVEHHVPRDARRLMVLGAGAMRLPWELGRRLPDIAITAVERDPVLCGVFDRMQSGDVVELFEVSPSPRDVASVAKRHRLQLPDQSHPVDVVLADALAWAPPSPVDVVVTPFFIDATNSDAIELVRRCTGWLRPGGTWINIGPMAWRAPAVATSYTVDEVIDRLAELGLSLGHREEIEMDHLASPYSDQTVRYRATMTVSTR